MRLSTAYTVMAVALVMGSAIAACGKGTPTASPTVIARPSASAASSGPLLGGAAFIASFRKLNGLILPMYGDAAAAAQRGDFTLATSDVRDIRAGIYAWDAQVRKITFDPSIATQVNAVLSANIKDIAAFDTWGIATTASEYQAGFQQEATTGAAAFTADLALEQTLDVETATPTAHMTAGSLRVAVASDTGGVFASDSGANFTAAYQAGGGYVISSQANGQAGLENANSRTPLALSQERVEADVTVTNSVEPGLLCLTGGNGTTVSAYYAFGIDVTNQQAVVQYFPPANHFDGWSEANIPAPSVKTSGINHLRLDCVDHYLTFFVNGTAVLQTYDPSLTSGSAGVYAVGTGPAGGSATFSHFTIRGI